MKKKEHLALSDYVDIWKVILYLLISKNVSKNEPNSLLLPKAIKFHNVNSAVDEYYAKAFSPEIINAIKFVEKSKIAAELVSKYAKASGEESEEIAFSESLFQVNLMYVQNKFEEAFSSKLPPANNPVGTDVQSLLLYRLSFLVAADQERYLVNAA